ncbi:hypothetical protein QEH56_08705 [Pelagicoccus enzymogenes]|uniref:hypothetical protein n=1 Tax=Pelagicoccus enzymogenes TaxID=2773457 RepID=UPI0028108770|nr:hypothetical protein [Pelagicoccus enzymogenes]MDQ8198223.1 hypothetical protein [Pelagicoccus enzymogenes]
MDKGRKRNLLALIALFLGGAIPIQLVTLSFGYAQYIRKESLGPKVILTAHEFAEWYIPFVYIPALLGLLGIGLYCRKRYPDIWRRIWVGFAMGATATLALDAIRQMGVIHGWLPGDTPVMFGKMATGSSVFSEYYWAGLAIHFINGANFGIVYAFVWGKRKSAVQAAIWGVVWSETMELGMMLGPPMGPMVGLFGVRYAWPQLFALTFVAHIAFGLAMGLLVQHFLTNREHGPVVRLNRSPVAN